MMLLIMLCLLWIVQEAQNGHKVVQQRNVSNMATDAARMANSADPDQTSPSRALLRRVRPIS